MPVTEARLTEDAAGSAPRKSATAKPRQRQPGRTAQAPRNAAVIEEDDRGLEAHEAEDAGDGLSFEDEDRALALFLDSMQDSVLPDLPDIPGHHVCWLTTTNPRDPISRRLTAGYRLIREIDFPHLRDSSVKTGDYAGVIGVNEMVAARLPMRQYQRAMGVLHHDRPNAEESKIRAKVEDVKDNAERDGARVVEVGDGTANLGKGTSSPAPRFH